MTLSYTDDYWCRFLIMCERNLVYLLPVVHFVCDVGFVDQKISEICYSEMENKILLYWYSFYVIY